MEQILIPIVGEAVKEIVIPVLGAVLLGVGTWVGAAIRQKTGVEVTEQLNTLLHRALQRAVEGLLAKYGTIPPNARELIASQLKETNSQTLKKLKVSPIALNKIIDQAIATVAKQVSR